MSTVVNAQNQLTLMELAKRTNDKNTLEIAEVLTEDHPLIDDAIYVASNQPTSHVGTQRTSLPAGTWRRINQGIDSEASSTKQVTEPMGMLTDLSKVDEKLVDLSGDPAMFRSGEDLAFVEGLSQTLETAYIYGSKADDPEKFDGFATRYNLTSMANVWGNSGTGSDTTSFWFIQWGPKKVHLIYPPNGKLGITTTDMGIQLVNDAAGKPFRAYVTYFQVDSGIYVHDDRCVQRIANIETSGSSNTLNDDLLICALNQMPKRGGGVGTAGYANRTLCTQFDIMAKDKTNVYYTSDNVFGDMVTMFRRVPIRLCDAILDSETAIS